MSRNQNRNELRIQELKEQVFWLKRSGNTARKIMDRRLRLIHDLKIAKQYLEFQLNVEVTVDD